MRWIWPTLALAAAEIKDLAGQGGGERDLGAKVETVAEIADAAQNSTKAITVPVRTAGLSDYQKVLMGSLDKEVKAFKVEIRTAKSDIEGGNKKDSSDFTGYLDKVIGLDDASSDNIKKAQSESKETGDQIGILVDVGQRPVKEAQKIVTDLERFEDQTSQMREQSRTIQGFMPSQLTMGSEMTTQDLKAGFTKAYGEMANLFDRQHQKTQISYDRNSQKFQTQDSKLHSTIRNFRDKTFQMERGTRERIVEGKKFNKDQIKTESRKMKAMTAAIKKARKTTVKGYKLAPKTIMKMQKKFAKTMDKTYRQGKEDDENGLEKFTEKIEKNAEKMTDGVHALRKKAEAATKTFLNDMQKETKANHEKTGAMRDRVTTAANFFATTLSDVNALQQNVNTLRNEFSERSSSSQIGTMSSIQSEEKKLTKNSAKRNPEIVAGIDKEVGNTQEVINAVASALATTVDVTAEEVSEGSQEVVEGLKTPLAQAVSRARNTKVDATTLSSAVSVADAEISAADVQAARIKSTTQAVYDEYANALEQAATGARQHGHIGNAAYERASTAAVDLVKQKFRKRMTDFPIPIQAKLTNSLRTLDQALSYEKVNQGQSLKELTVVLDQIYRALDRNPGKEDKMIYATLPEHFTSAATKEAELWRGLDALVAETRKEEERLKNHVDLNKMTAISDMNNVAAEHMRTVHTTLQHRMHEFGKLLQMMVQINKLNRGANIETAESTKLVREDYMEALDKLKDTFDGVMELAKQQFQVFTAKTQEMDGPQTQEFRTVGSTGIEDADVAIKATVHSIQEEEKLDLKHSEGELMAAQQNKRTNLLALVTRKADQVRAIPFEHLYTMIKKQRAAILEQQATADENRDRIKNHQEELRSRSEAEVLFAQKVALSVKSLKSTRGKVMGSTAELMQSEMDSYLKSVEREVTGTYKEDFKDIRARFAALDKEILMRARKGRDASKHLQESVTETRDRVAHVQATVKEIEERTRTRISEASKGAKGKIMEQQADLESNEQNREEDMAVTGKRMQEMTDREEAITDDMRHGSDDNSQANDNRNDQLASKMEAAAKSMKISKEATWMGLNGALENGRTAFHGDQVGVEIEEKDLHRIAAGLNQKRIAVEAKAARDVGSFELQVKELNKELGRDATFLDNYQSFALQKELSLIQKTTGIIVLSAKQAEDMYNGILDAEFDVLDKSVKTMGSDGFTTMKKIRDADLKMKLGIEEDSSMVRKLGRHSENSLPWMENVLEALETEHDEMLASKEGGGDREKALQDRQAAQLAAIVAKGEGEVEGDPTAGRYGALTTMTDEAMASLNATRMDMQSTANMGLNALGALEAGQGKGARDEAKALEEESLAMEDKGREGSEIAQGVMDDVAKLSKIERDKLRMQRDGQSNRMSKLLDEASGIPSPETLNAPPADGGLGSLLEKGGRKVPPSLAAMLAKTVELKRLHAGLEKKHGRLGQQVHEVSSAMRAFRGRASGAE